MLNVWNYNSFSHMHNNIDENNYVYVKIINSTIYMYIYDT